MKIKNKIKKVNYRLLFKSWKNKIENTIYEKIIRVKITKKTTQNKKNYNKNNGC